MGLLRRDRTAPKSRRTCPLVFRSGVGGVVGKGRGGAPGGIECAGDCSTEQLVDGAECAGLGDGGIGVEGFAEAWEFEEAAEGAKVFVLAKAFPLEGDAGCFSADEGSAFLVRRK